MTNRIIHFENWFSLILLLLVIVVGRNQKFLTKDSGASCENFIVPQSEFIIIESRQSNNAGWAVRREATKRPSRVLHQLRERSLLCSIGVFLCLSYIGVFQAAPCASRLHIPVWCIIQRYIYRGACLPCLIFKRTVRFCRGIPLR